MSTQNNRSLTPTKLGVLPKGKQNKLLRFPSKKGKATKLKKSSDEGTLVKAFSHTCMFLKRDDAKRLVYGVVYEPHVEDADGEFSIPEEITKSAHRFLADYRVMKVQHLTKNDQIEPVESYIAPVDFEMNGEMVKAGSWVLVSRVLDDEVWGLVVKGELTGYSMGGYATRIPNAVRDGS
jgi:hypothetical protein